jgi:transketolase
MDTARSVASKGLRRHPLDDVDKYKAQKEYYKKHKDEIKEYQREYQKEYQKLYRELNRQAYNKMHNDYYHGRKRQQISIREKYKDNIRVYI